MPIIVTRHGLLDSNGHLNTDGQKYANSLRSILDGINVNLAGKMWGLYADPFAGPDGYQRCYETIRPLAESIPFGISDVTLFGAKFFEWLQEDCTGTGVMCVRLEDSINPIREYLGLPAWPNACAFKYLAIVTKDRSGSGWTWKNYQTGQPPITPPCNE